MKIIYVHHALRDMGNPPTQEDGIKQLGRRDAQIVAELLDELKSEGRNIKAIYSSPFFRCMETSRIINQKINVPIIQEERFNEYKSVNETWVELQTRVINAIYDIVERYDDKDIVICVTSGVNVVSFMSLAYKLPPNENAPFVGVPSCSPLMFNITKENFSL